MTEQQIITLVSNMSGESNEGLVSAFVSMAGDAILNRCYPFATEQEIAGLIVPTRYQSLQCEIAVFLLEKRGAEGETAHNENGINRSYENGSVPESMLRRVTPFCRPLGG